MFSSCTYGYGFLSRGFTDRREILHGGSAWSQTGYLLFWGIAPGVAEFWASTGAIWPDMLPAEALVCAYFVFYMACRKFKLRFRPKPLPPLSKPSLLRCTKLASRQLLGAPYTLEIRILYRRMSSVSIDLPIAAYINAPDKASCCCCCCCSRLQSLTAVASVCVVDALYRRRAIDSLIIRI